MPADERVGAESPRATPAVSGERYVPDRTDDNEVYVGEHVLLIGQDFASGEWEAECSCGWASTDHHRDEADAVDEWDYHCDRVFDEATSG